MSGFDAGDDPFANLPMFGDLARALAGQGPLNWDVARQFAALAATGGAAEPNVDPAQRIALEQLAAIARMHVADVIGTGCPAADVVAVTPGLWAQRTLEAYRPLFTELATSLARRPEADDGDDADPMAAMLQGLSQLMGPTTMGMAIGSMIGRMAKEAFGQYDLPIPRVTTELLVLPAAIGRFAEAWTLPADELGMWVISQELIGHTVFSLGSVRDELTALVRRHAGSFRPDPNALAEHLGSIEGLTGDGDPAAALQQMMSDPAVVLGAVESPEQRELQPQLDAAFTGIVGLVDYFADAVSVRLIGGESMTIAEAIRRRRVERTPDDVYVQRLLGLALTQAQVQRGKAFIGGVVDRVGEGRLVDLMSQPQALPTPAEIEAPGLWVARLEL